jgi:2-iminobutanoate/2-iminopropanoate deaminase
MDKRSITAPDGAMPVGPYSPALIMGGLLFSAQGPFDADGAVVGRNAAEQARKTLDNIGGLLRAANLGIDNVAKTTIYLTEMADFAAVNDVYAEFFTEPYPARSTVGVHSLPRGVKIIIDVIAVAETGR